MDGWMRKRDDVLTELRYTARRLSAERFKRDDLIITAVQRGLTEREIGKAAGMSGPAINQRKQEMRKAGLLDRNPGPK